MQIAPDLVMITYDSYDIPDKESVAKGLCSFATKVTGGHSAAASCIPRYQLLRVSMNPPDVYPIVMDELGEL